MKLFVYFVEIVLKTIFLMLLSTMFAAPAFAELKFISTRLPTSYSAKPKPIVLCSYSDSIIAADNNVCSKSYDGLNWEPIAPPPGIIILLDKDPTGQLLAFMNGSEGNFLIYGYQNNQWAQLQDYEVYMSDNLQRANHGWYGNCQTPKGQKLLYISNSLELTELPIPEGTITSMGIWKNQYILISVTGSGPFAKSKFYTYSKETDLWLSHYETSSTILTVVYGEESILALAAVQFNFFYSTDGVNWATCVDSSKPSLILHMDQELGYHVLVTQMETQPGFYEFIKLQSRIGDVWEIANGDNRKIIKGNQYESDNSTITAHMNIREDSLWIDYSFHSKDSEVAAMSLIYYKTGIISYKKILPDAAFIGNSVLFQGLSDSRTVYLGSQVTPKAKVQLIYSQGEKSNIIQFHSSAIQPFYDTTYFRAEDPTGNYVPLFADIKDYNDNGYIIPHRDAVHYIKIESRTAEGELMIESEVTKIDPQEYYLNILRKTTFPNEVTFESVNENGEYEFLPLSTIEDLLTKDHNSIYLTGYADLPIVHRGYVAYWPWVGDSTYNFRALFYANDSVDSLWLYTKGYWLYTNATYDPFFYRFINNDLGSWLYYISWHYWIWYGQNSDKSWDYVNGI